MRKIWSNKSVSWTEVIGVFLAFVTVVVGGIYGWYQYRINTQLLEINSNAKITSILWNSKNGFIELRNTGKCDLFLHGISFIKFIGKDGSIETVDKTNETNNQHKIDSADEIPPQYETKRINPPVFIAADEGYRTGFPINITPGHNGMLILFLKDKNNNRWISENSIYNDSNNLMTLLPHGTFKVNWEYKNGSFIFSNKKMITGINGDNQEAEKGASIMNINWINNNSGAISALASVALVIVTLMYVRLTWKIVRETEKQRGEVEKERLESAEPLVYGVWSSNIQQKSENVATWCATILNKGRGVAYDIQVQKREGEAWVDIELHHVLSPGSNWSIRQSLPMNCSHKIKISCKDKYGRCYSTVDELSDTTKQVEYVLEQDD